MKLMLFVPPFATPSHAVDRDVVPVFTSLRVSSEKACMFLIRVELFLDSQMPRMNSRSYLHDIATIAFCSCNPFNSDC